MSQLCHNGVNVHRNLLKNYLKLGKNYGIGLRLGLGLGLVFRFRDTQWHYGAIVCFIWTLRFYSCAIHHVHWLRVRVYSIHLIVFAMYMHSM